MTRSRYRIDQDDVIRWVSDGWIDFAHQNTDGSWDPASVVGRSLWSYIEGAEVRHLYELLLRRVRTARIRIDVPFRCDGPEVRRDMRLRLEPLEQGGVQLTVARPEEAPGRDEAVDDEIAEGVRDVLARPDLIPLCSWCDRLLLQGIGWMDVEAAVEALDLFDGGSVPRMTHGVCPDCYGDVTVGLERRD